VTHDHKAAVSPLTKTTEMSPAETRSIPASRAVEVLASKLRRRSGKLLLGLSTLFFYLFLDLILGRSLDQEPQRSKPC